MKIGLLQDRILVKRIEEEETAAGGIIIPDAKEKPQEGKIIIAVGNDLIRSREAPEARCQEWRPRALRRASGTEVTLEDEEHLIIHEDDVLGIVE